MIIEDLSHTVPSPTRYFNKLHRYATWRKMAVLQRPRYMAENGGVATSTEKRFTTVSRSAQSAGH